MSKPLVSVVVPVYNIQDYVKRCLDSLLGQSYDKMEIIVVDDGSTDASGAVCDDAARRDKRVKVLHQKNGGLSQARNRGIKEAKGEYICLVDGDDYVMPDFVRILVETAEAKNADVVVCAFNGQYVMPKILSGREATIKLLVGQENVEIVAWNKLYKKYLFDGVRYPVGKKYEDTLTTYKLLARSRGVVYRPESLYFYEKRNDSIMGEGDVLSRLRAREEAAEEAVRFFGDDQELLDAARVALLTAKYAFLDFAIKGEIDGQYGERAKKWIIENVESYRMNKFLSSRLKIYNMMLTKMGGVMYGMFRKLRHE